MGQSRGEVALWGAAGSELPEEGGLELGAPEQGGLRGQGRGACGHTGRALGHPLGSQSHWLEGPSPSRVLTA